MSISLSKKSETLQNAWTTPSKVQEPGVALVSGGAVSTSTQLMRTPEQVAPLLAFNRVTEKHAKDLEKVGSGLAALIEGVLAERMAAMEQNPVLHALGAAALRELALNATAHGFKAAEQVFDQGAVPNGGTYLVTSGSASVTRDGSFVAYLVAGEMTGQVSLTDPSSGRKARVTASEPHGMETLILPSDMLALMLEKSPAAKKVQDDIVARRKKLLEDAAAGA